MDYFASGLQFVKYFLEFEKKGRIFHTILDFGYN